MTSPSPAAVSHDVILIPTALDPSSRTFYLIPLVFFIVSIFRHNYLIAKIGLFSTSSLFAETMPYVTQTGLTLWAQEMLLPQPPGVPEDTDTKHHAWPLLHSKCLEA